MCSMHDRDIKAAHDAMQSDLIFRRISISSILVVIISRNNSFENIPCQSLGVALARAYERGEFATQKKKGQNKIPP